VEAELAAEAAADAAAKAAKREQIAAEERRLAALEQQRQAEVSVRLWVCLAGMCLAGCVWRAGVSDARMEHIMGTR
jgi:hypothetical protein